MKLWKVHIKDYFYGVIYYDLLVLLDTESNMLREVYKYPVYHKSEDSEIVGYEQIDLSNETIRIL